MSDFVPETNGKMTRGDFDLAQQIEGLSVIEAHARAQGITANWLDSLCTIADHSPSRRMRNFAADVVDYDARLQRQRKLEAEQARAAHF